MTVYLLYYDNEEGNREDWNTFYTPVEIFDNEKKREERKKELAAQGFEFHEIEVEVQ